MTDGFAALVYIEPETGAHLGPLATCTLMDTGEIRVECTDDERIVFVLPHALYQVNNGLWRNFWDELLPHALEEDW